MRLGHPSGIPRSPHGFLPQQGPGGPFMSPMRGPVHHPMNQVPGQRRQPMSPLAQSSPQSQTPATVNSVQSQGSQSREPGITARNPASVPQAQPHSQVPPRTTVGHPKPTPLEGKKAFAEAGQNILADGNSDKPVHLVIEELQTLLSEKSLEIASLKELVHFYEQKSDRLDRGFDPPSNITTQEQNETPSSQHNDTLAKKVSGLLEREEYLSTVVTSLRRENARLREANADSGKKEGKGNVSNSNQDVVEIKRLDLELLYSQLRALEQVKSGASCIESHHLDRADRAFRRIQELETENDKLEGVIKDMHIKIEALELTMQHQQWAADRTTAKNDSPKTDDDEATDSKQEEVSTTSPAQEESTEEPVVEESEEELDEY